MDSVLKEFINTLWKQNHGYGKDPLEDPIWLKQFEAKFSCHLTLNIEGCSDELKALRAVFLKSIQEAVSDQVDDNALLTLIDTGFKGCSGTRTVQKQGDLYSYGFKPNIYDLHFLKAELLARFYDLLFITDRSRIRICENPDCQYVFFDDSKNKTKRHCHSGCSNLMKVRRFRDKQKKEG